MGKAHKRVPRSGLKFQIAEFVRLAKSMIDPYRPELHYMRGPGPKWHAKHAAVPVQTPNLSGLARAQG